MTLAEKIAETAARFIEASGDWHEEGREYVRLRELVREWREGERVSRCRVGLTEGRLTSGRGSGMSKPEHGDGSLISPKE